MRSHSEWFPEALLSLYVPEHVDFNSPAGSYDYLADVYGNALIAEFPRPAARDAS